MKISKKIKILLFLCFFIIFILFLFLYKKKINTNTNNYQLPIKLTPTKKFDKQSANSSVVSIKPEVLFFDRDNFYQPIKFEVLLDSKNYPIIGYDLVFEYDPKILKLNSFNNLLNDKFDIYKIEKDNHLFFTGIKKTNYQREIIFNQEPVLKLTWQVLAPKSTVIKLIANPGRKNDSNLIVNHNNQMEDLINKEQRILVVNGIKVQLGLDEVKRIKSLELKLLQINLPPKNCRDCLEEIVLLVKQDTEEKKINFRFGGFAGLMINNAEAFGYNLILENFSDREATLFIYEK